MSSNAKCKNNSHSCHFLISLTRNNTTRMLRKTELALRARTQVLLKSTTASYLLFAMKVVESKKRKRKRRKKGQAKVVEAIEIEETPFGNKLTVASPNLSVMPFLSPPMMMSPGDNFGSLPGTIKSEDEASMHNEATTFSFL